MERRRKPPRRPRSEPKSYEALRRRLAAGVLRLRTAREWTQAEAAHRCGMTTWQYQRVETALTSATLTTIARLVDGFEVPLEELFDVATASSRTAHRRP